MIVFDLRCGNAHVFEAWFGSSDDYADQKQRGLIACPMCGDAQIAKAVMAPNVAAKGNSRAEATSVPVAMADKSPDEIKAVLGALAKAQAAMLEQSQWVGRDFADKARAMHLGETDTAAIHGEVSSDQARALIDEGVPVAPLPFPVIPPEAQN